jgi:hypothetical protein
MIDSVREIESARIAYREMARTRGSVIRESLRIVRLRGSVSAARVNGSDIGSWAAVNYQDVAGRNVMRVVLGDDRIRKYPLILVGGAGFHLSGWGGNGGCAMYSHSLGFVDSDSRGRFASLKIVGEIPLHPAKASVDQMLNGFGVVLVNHLEAIGNICPYGLTYMDNPGKVSGMGDCPRCGSVPALKCGEGILRDPSQLLNRLPIEETHLPSH